MPIAISENPPVLEVPLEEPLQAFEQNSPFFWFVIQTKSRAEKQAALWLASQGIPFFLPYIAVISTNRTVAFNPRFSGILFAAASPQTNRERELGGNANGSKGSFPEKDPVPVFSKAEEASAFYEAESLIRTCRHMFSILSTKNQPRLKRELLLVYSISDDPRDPSASPSLKPRYSPENPPQSNELVRFRPGTPFEGLEGRVLKTSKGAGANGKGNINPSGVTGAANSNNFQKMSGTVHKVKPQPIRVWLEYSFAKGFYPTEVDASMLEPVWVGQQSQTKG